jgi:predicted amidohydrolase YtcJ
MQDEQARPAGDNAAGAEDQATRAGEKARISRRSIFGAAALAGAAVGLSRAVPAGAAARVTGGEGADLAPELILANGKIHTVDARDSVVPEVGIRAGRIVRVGRQPRPREARVIDLKGATVVPGLIEGHVHIVSLANRPGYHVVIENARNIAEIQAMLAARRKDVPDGQFITAMGGWSPNFFAERRLPTLAELDAAVSDRPVFLYGGGIGRTNTLGKRWFESQTPAVTVAEDGTMAGGPAGQNNLALYHLRVKQTFEDKRRSALDCMAYSASLGLTSALDQTLPPDSGPLSPKQGLGNLNNFRMYDPWLSLHREGKAFTRLQMNFLHDQNDMALPELKERLKNQFQLFGDDMMMTGGIGEWGAPGDGEGPVWLEAQRLIAEARWRNTNRTLNAKGLEDIISGYEKIHAKYDISGLRWTIHHVPFATVEQLNRMKAMRVGVQCGAWRFVGGVPGNAGSPFKTILESGIQNGLHMDGVHIAPLNPWMAVYYASTGVNAMGQKVNGDEQITRQQAIKLYTRENAWHLNMEDRLGSLEPGKHADLTVLNRDHMTCTDEELKRMAPVMTMVGGKIVHDTAGLGGRKA